MSIKIAIADDHPIVLEGLGNLLGGNEELQLCGMYRDGTTLLKGLKLQQPDVLLLDVQMPGMQGDELAKIIVEEFPGIQMIALTNMDQPFMVRTMFTAGVKGYLLKSADRVILWTAIQCVYKGGQYLDKSLQEIMLNDVMRGEQEKPMLSQRETQIMELIAEEMTSKEIAKKLFLSVPTVEISRTNLFLKLEVKNAAGLVRKGIQLGLLK